MKVRLFGFSLKAGNSKATLAQLYDHLETNSGQPDNTRPSERRIYFSRDASADYAHGLVVTVKDQKAFCKFVKEKGTFKISVETLVGEDKLMEFNFFVINKNNGLGIYQQYFHSCSLGVFGGYLKEDYRQISDHSASKMVSDLHRNGKHTEVKEKAIRKLHGGQLEVATLVHKGTLAAVLEEFGGKISQIFRIRVRPA